MKKSWDPRALAKLAPGAWQWGDGVGFRRAEQGDGGTWWIRFRVPIIAGSTRTKQVAERLPDVSTRTQADSVLTKRRAEVFEGRYRPQVKTSLVTVEQFAKTFVANKKAKGLASWKTYEGQLRRAIIPALGNKPVAALTRKDCRKFYDDRCKTKSPRWGTTLTQATAHHEIACLRSMLSDALDAGIIDRNPAAALRIPTPDNERERRIVPDELERLEAKLGAKPSRLRMAFWLMRLCGLRISETMGLAKADIDREGQRLWVRSKGGEREEIPIPAKLEPEFALWWPRTAGSPWLFPQFRDKTKHTGQEALRKAWDALCTAAKVEDLHPHDLRHHLSTELKRSGVDPSLAMRIMRHKSWQMWKRYSQASMDELRAALERTTADPISERSQDGEIPSNAA